MRSATAINSSSSEEISSTAAPRPHAARIWPYTAATAPTSRPRVGCAAEQKRQFRQRDLARQHRFLLDSAGQRRERHLRPRGAHVEARHQFARGAHEFLAPEEAVGGETLEPVQENIFGDAHLDHAADCVAVLRHHADAGGRDLLRGKMRRFQFAEKNAAARRRRHAREDGRQFALAVALDAGDDDDLARPDRQGELVQPGHALPVGDGQSIDLNRFARRRLLALSMAGRPPASRTRRSAPRPRSRLFRR